MAKFKNKKTNKVVEETLNFYIEKLKNNENFEEIKEVEKTFSPKNSKKIKEVEDKPLQ